MASLAPGARVVKVGNTLLRAVWAADPRQAGGHRVLFMSGDDASANTEVNAVLEKLGFATIDLGALAIGGAISERRAIADPLKPNAICKPSAGFLMIGATASGVEAVAALAKSARGEALNSESGQGRPTPALVHSPMAIACRSSRLRRLPVSAAMDRWRHPRNACLRRCRAQRRNRRHTHNRRDRTARSSAG